MKRNQNRGPLFLICLYSVIVFSIGCKGTNSPERTAQTVKEKPNVIVIYTDDLGYGDVSCYGATRIQTPNIDSLANDGLSFTNAHAMASTCTPSRYSILTGEYAFRNQDAEILPGNASLLISQDQATLGTIFQKAGYRTGCVGKWHVGLGPEGGPDWNGEVKPGPNEVGFDYSFIFPATADRVPTVYVENHHVVALDHQDPIKVSYKHKVGDDPTGREHPELLKMGLTKGHDGTIINGISRIGWMAGGYRARWTDESLASDFFQQVQTFIEKNQNHPFFLYYAMNEIHVPRMPDTRFKGKSKLGYRGDVILEMDYFVGKLLKTLDYLNLTENTIVVFTSDNGPVLDDGYADKAVEKNKNHQPAGPFRGGKYSMYEGGTCVPFIIKWPGAITPNTTSDALVGQVDLLASFANLLEVEVDSSKIDSKDILHTLLGNSKEGRQSIVEQDNRSALALVKNGWKYIAPHKGDSLIRWAKMKSGYIESGLNMQPQLFNLKKDKGEQHNLAAKLPEKVEKMADELQKIKAGKQH